MLLIRTRASLISAGTEKMLVEFGKANLLAKAKAQPDKVKQVLDKIKTDGLLPTLEAVPRKLFAAILERIRRLRGAAGEAYNIASWRDMSVQQVIDGLIAISGLRVSVQAVPGRFRAMDVSCVRADVSNIAAATGWRAGIGLRESLAATW